MSFTIQTNVNSLIAQENIRVNNEFQSRTIQRLTSGYRINSSEDDAAGLSVANKYRSDIAELSQGVRNANDGISLLQIIDGGLNNISKMLDRMKTLATQSASSTFTGDRATLQAEYNALKSEIDRQAANIGLGSGTVEASRNNKDITVYIGGGAGQANASASVNLSGASNLVNSTGMSLNSTSVDGASTDVELAAGNFNGNSLFLDQGSSQTFRFATPDVSVDVTVRGDTDGLTGEEIVQQLNTGLQGTGVTVSIDSDGDIVASSSNAFAVAIDAKAGGGAQVSAAVANANAKVNTGMYNVAGGAVTAVTGTGGPDDATVTFTQGANTYAVTITEDDTIQDVFDNIKAALKDSDIKVLRLGDEIMFQSTSDFDAEFAAGTGTTSGGIANLDTDGDALTVTAATSPTDVTTNAKAALTAINNAVEYLGTLQGTVGSGQNKLRYAIQLAQSQIASYSAAESRIRDADIAQEAANLTKAQVLQQASLAAMTQANSAPQSVLALLKG